MRCLLKQATAALGMFRHQVARRHRAHDPCCTLVFNHAACATGKGLLEAAGHHCQAGKDFENAVRLMLEQPGTEQAALNIARSSQHSAAAGLAAQHLLAQQRFQVRGFDRKRLSSRCCCSLVACQWHCWISAQRKERDPYCLKAMAKQHFCSHLDSGYTVLELVMRQGSTYGVKL